MKYNFDKLITVKSQADINRHVYHKIVNNNKKRLDKDISLCIKKIGMVRYSAFKDTGSDLSFALALLNDNNDGVLLNGIYSREMSNIYAKQVNQGKTNVKLSDEEKQALEIAINN